MRCGSRSEGGGESQLGALERSLDHSGKPMYAGDTELICQKTGEDFLRPRKSSLNAASGGQFCILRGKRRADTQPGFYASF